MGKIPDEERLIILTTIRLVRRKKREEKARFDGGQKSAAKRGRGEKASGVKEKAHVGVARRGWERT